MAAIWVLLLAAMITTATSGGTGGGPRREATLRNSPTRRGVKAKGLASRRDVNGTALRRSFPLRHTISGVSAGGSMVANHLVAFSKVVKAAAINAGSAYGCGSLGPDFDNTCNCKF